jgi:aspartate racemase
MKTIGLLGGMSWESTASYYQAINEAVNRRLGGLSSAAICMYSVNFAEIEKLQRLGRWDETAQILSEAAQSVEVGGADFLLICTNTMHKVASEIQSHIHIPVLHIVDATAEILLENSIQTVGLLGTRFTMEQGFYKDRLSSQFGINVLVPGEQERELIHRIIYDELCQGVMNNTSRQIYLDIMARLHQSGAEAIVLGCTEIALLVRQEHTDIPLFDTTAIHAAKAVSWALA